MSTPSAEPKKKPGHWGPLIAAIALVLGLLALQRWKPRSPEVPTSKTASPASSPREWRSQNDPRVIPLAGQVVLLGLNTQVRMIGESADGVQLLLVQGDLRVQQSRPVIGVETRHLKAVPLGTDYGVATNEHRTYVKSLAGQVKVLEIESGKSTTLGPQQSLQVPPPPPVKFTPKSPAKGPEAAGTPSP